MAYIKVIFLLIPFIAFIVGANLQDYIIYGSSDFENHCAYEELIKKHFWNNYTCLSTLVAMGVISWSCDPYHMHCYSRCNYIVNFCSRIINWLLGWLFSLYIYI